jgi:hypothetical protein
MDTSTLSSLYSSDGPFATVLIDVSRDNENGDHEHDLRVRAACEELRTQGADERVIGNVRRGLSDATDLPAPAARLVVATAEGVAYQRTAGQRVDQTVASYGPLPDLLSWIERRDSAVTFVLAVVDHEGGDVALFNSEVPEPEKQESVGGEARFVHKVPTGGWSALRYQHNTDNVWARNADAVVDEIRGHVRQGNRLVLLAGDPKSRGLVRDGLEGSEVELIELETGTRADDGGDEAMQQAVRESLMRYVAQRRLALVHQLDERVGRDQGVAVGVDDVADAFVRGQVETLLVDRAAAAKTDLDLGQHRGLSLGQAGQTRVRAADGLVAAAVLTGADVSVVPSSAMDGAPVAALLRWA